MVGRLLDRAALGFNYKITLVSIQAFWIIAGQQVSVQPVCIGDICKEMD